MFQSKSIFGSTEVVTALAKSRGAWTALLLFSILINVLALTSSLYMLQLYDRVIPSRSVTTLVGLTMLMLLLFGSYGILDVVRSRVLHDVGLRIDRDLRARVSGLVLALPLVRSGVDAMQPQRDLDQVRAFVAGPGPVALFDLPWLPIYLFLVFLLHPSLGLLALAGALALVVLTVLTELRSKGPTRAAQTAANRRLAVLEAARRNAAAVRGLGMAPHIQSRFAAETERYFEAHTKAADVATVYGTLSKVGRYVIQSVVLGLGAYLVIHGQATGGVMIAASILVSRALAPVEVAIANWHNLIATRQSAVRLAQLLNARPAPELSVELPRPSKRLTVEGLWVAAPGEQTPTIKNVSFDLVAGDGLGIIGPSAAGKSTLARAIVGAWAAQRGTVQLDGVSIEQWSPEVLGRFVGYLPQDVELFAGRVAENIARMSQTALSSEVLQAAEKAGAHQMIVKLPKGYETPIGEAGQALSAGQRQRIGLARALYGDPFLVVLDEPNSNLDMDGDQALAETVRTLRAAGRIVIVIAHRPSGIAGLNKLLMLSGGEVQAFGARDEVLRKVVQATGGAHRGVSIAAE
jgi:ATP-binding cassette subfamily C protein